MINKLTLRTSFLVVAQLLFFGAIASGQEKGPVEFPPLTLSEKFVLAQKSKQADPQPGSVNGSSGGNIPASNSPATGGVRRLTLNEAKMRAFSSNGISISQLAVEAAKQHRLGVQADYFPKLTSAFANLHFNKFMGDQIRLFRRGSGVAVPLLDKDTTLVTVTAVQPI